MNERQIQRFFRTLAEEFPKPARIILTGAAAGSLWGSRRPSLDIDFGIMPARGGRGAWRELEAAITRTTQLTGIQTNYAQDIGRWGQIGLGDYRRHTIAYRRFGKLQVRLLDPVYWSIGKVSRYLQPDIQDLIAVFARRRTPPGRCIRIWANALRNSSPSAAQAQFRRQVEHFLRTYGRAVWGRRFDAEQAVRLFHRHAGIFLEL